MLTAEGHTTEAAPDSATGIGLHHQNPFDLIITDIIMPGKEGISTIIELRKEFPGLKIIAISGGGDFEPFGYLDIAKRVGADRTLPKPFSRNQLIETIDDLMGES